MTDAKKIFDALNQHNTYLQRLSSSSVNEILKKFDGLSLEMLTKLQMLLEDLTETEKTILASGRYTTKPLKDVQGVMANWQQSIAVVLPEIFTASAVALAVHEANYTYQLANRQAPQVKGEKLITQVKKTPYAGGQLVDHIFPGIAESTRKKVEHVIRDGIEQGQTTPQIVQRIKGTKKQNYAHGLLNQTRSAIDAEVKTARAHVSNSVYLDTWKALGFEYTKDVATLDGRTSKICAVNDGRVQKIGEGHQKPPYHRRCRTVQIGCDQGGEVDGVRPYVSDKRKVKDIPKDQLQGKIGQVDANTNFGSWFNTQDEAFQKEWLGPSKYKLYKEGGYPLDKFVDPLSGQPFTLKQLKAVDEKTFKELGL